MFARLLELLDRWVWPFLIPTVVVIYWLTSSLELSAVFPSLKSAVPALQSATWLYGHESRRPNQGGRAMAILMMYVATGIWEAACAATLTILAMALLANQCGLQPNTDQVETLLKTMACSLSAACFVGLTGIVLAWKSKTKVWLHPQIFHWCQGDFRNTVQLQPYARRFNHATFILATSIGLPGVAAGAFALAYLTATGKPVDDNVAAVSNRIMLVAFVGYPILAILIIAYLSHRIVAACPHDCWPESDAKHIEPKKFARS